MPTRGVYGFIKKGVEKIGYNHCDSYICELGANIAKFISETTKEEMEEIFEKIILVDTSTEATDEQIKKCEKWFQPIQGREKSNWYNLLRLTQGNLYLYKESELEYMFNGEDLYVEYKYIINLDNSKFEIYETDFETEEEKMIGIYPLDKVNESDIQALYKIRLEEEKIRALAKKEEKERMLSEKIEVLSQDEAFIKYYNDELSLQKEMFEHYLEMSGIEGIIDEQEIKKIYNEKEREKILSEKIDVVYRHVVFSMCVSKYAGITL